MKCIVTETSPERINAKPVTNDDGTPHIYATMAEARAELKANGYSYNRANTRYYINGTEYRAYILRADSEEYAEIMEQAEQQAAPEYIEAEATAHQWSPEETAQEIEYRAAIRTANRAAIAVLDAYADAIGEHPTEDDPETRAAYLVARDEITGTSARATDYDRETVELMTEAIARSARRPDLSKYESVKYLEFDQPEPAPTYHRCELLAYLGAPDAYDVDAIEAEATAYDYSTGRTYWTAFGDDLAAIAERHELYSYAPAI